MQGAEKKRSQAAQSHENPGQVHEWYIHDPATKERRGTSVGELKLLLEAGGIGPAEPIQKADSAEWTPLSMVPELREALDIAEAREEDLEQWLFAGAEGKQQGPVSVNQMVQLAKSGIVNSSTLAWREGMSEWEPLGRINEMVALGYFQESSSAASPTAAAAASGPKNPDAVWFYVNNYRRRTGPVDPKTIVALYRKAEVSSVTLVWKEGMREWIQLSDVPELTDLITSESAEQLDTEQFEPSDHDEEEGARSRQQQGEDGNDGKNEGTEASGGAKRQKTAEEKAKDRERKKLAKKRKREQWHEMKETTSVYVSGLPSDVTVEELYEHFRKVGIIRQEEDGSWRIRIYRDEAGNVKGDGRITFLKPESVPLAIDILDNSDLRYGIKLRVEKAKFEMKGEKFVPKPKAEASASAAKKAPKVPDQTKLLDWGYDDGIVHGKAFRIVILKNMFTLEEAKQGAASFYEDLKVDVGSECERVAGPVEKVTVFANNPEGVIAVKFKSPADADKCIEVMNGRFFAGRRIECAYFDGKTNYKIQESEEETAKRLEAFADWLENE